MSTTTTTTQPPTAETLLATAATFLRIFQTLDPATILPIRGEHYTHVFAPSSVGPPPPLTFDQFAAHTGHLRGIMRSFPVTPRPGSTWANPAGRQVTVWADGVTDFLPEVRDSKKEGGDDGDDDGDDEWTYKGEYIFVLTMDETGTKVEHVLEFLDSKATDRLRVLMERAWLNKSGGEKGDPTAFGKGK